ncbi:hypothetical protein HZB74_01020 [Candidatus Saccharibacteria bacterium]|nr:hypothetical protein [Candidatus Saccharibacteria bacterium]
MICIFCGHETKVNNSRSKINSSSTWRRRECLNCEGVFTTKEKPDLTVAIKVIESSGKFKAFSEDKLFISVYECLSHKENSLKASKSLIDTVLEKILPIKGNKIKASTLAEETYRVLRRYDKATALIYKARHPIF